MLNPELPHSSHAHSNHAASRLSVGMASVVLSFAVLAADPPLAAAAATPVSTRTQLDLRTPPLKETMTQAEIDEVLSRTMEPRSLEEVEVGGARVFDPNSPDYIPMGFASLFWAANRPSGLWKVFTPMRMQKTHADINPVNPRQPAPGIPPMAGEGRPYDH